MRSSLFKLMTAAVILGVLGGCGGDRSSGEAAAPSPAEGSADVTEGSAMNESATAESSAADGSAAEDTQPMD